MWVEHCANSRRPSDVVRRYLERDGGAVVYDHVTPVFGADWLSENLVPCLWEQRVQQEQ
ncbi:hypothetical protein G3R49_19385 [Shewanella sp. WXL01]|nr:hypothetical protein [Shewanella sp. WXL01]